MGERVQKVIAAAGLCSRRRAEELIVEGRVLVNGRLAELGQRADILHDSIVVDGVVIRPPSGGTYLALHKPRGIVTTMASTHGEQTVLDLVHFPARVFPVGRLDKDTSGLLLLTDDGDWSNLVTHPRYAVEKEYRACVRGNLEGVSVRQLAGGVTLPGGEITAPSRIRVLQRSTTDTSIAITITEGKKRQIRLMFAAVGHPVIELVRVRVGPVLLGKLKPGEWRKLATVEVEAMRHATRSTRRGSRGSAPAPHRD